MATNEPRNPRCESLSFVFLSSSIGTRKVSEAEKGGGNPLSSFSFRDHAASPLLAL